MQKNIKDKIISSIKNFKSIFFIILLMLVFVLPVVALAQAGTVPPNPTPNPVPIKIANPFNCGGGSSSGNCTIFTLIYAILNNIVMPVAAVVVTMYIIYAGFTFLTAQGKPKEIQDAQQRLLWSLIGAGILLGAVGIAKVVENTIKALIAP